MGKYYKTAYMLPEVDLATEEQRWLFLNGYRGHSNTITLHSPSEDDLLMISRVKRRLPELRVVIK
jgi:hypothetical protein